MDLTEGLKANMDSPDARSVVRHEIENQVGDDKSLLGTLSDVSGVLMAAHAARVIALADHDSNEAQRQELDLLKQLAGEVDLVVLCRQFITDVQAGTIKLTASVKGMDAVVAEVAERSTLTADVLAEMAPATPT